MNKTFLSLHRIVALRVATLRKEMVEMSMRSYPLFLKGELDANGKDLLLRFQRNRKFVLISTIINIK